jgi:hypothetical protein
MLQRLRSERRAFSRDGARQYAAPNPTGGPDRAARRKQHWRGDISALVHGPHDRAWLYSGTENASGQARVNAKRMQRAEYWRTVQIRVSAEMEPWFRDSLHLLGEGTRIDGRTVPLNWFAVDLDVHIPGAPAEAVTATPVYRSEYNGDGTSTPSLDHIEWLRADGSRIDTTASLAAA